MNAYRDLLLGTVVTHNGYPMILARLERIPGGVSATLRPLDGVCYPHPVYLCGFTDAAVNVQRV